MAFRLATLVAFSLLAPALCLAADEEQAPAFAYILWDGHRFARTREQHERDFRWYRDMGFTHTYLGNANEEGPFNAERARWMLELADTCNMTVGLRMHFHRDLEDFAAKIGLTKEQMIGSGMLLSRKAKSGHPPYNPMHPDVIRYYSEGFAKAVDFYRGHDRGDRLKLFLIGTEMGWPLPGKPEAAYPKALDILYEAARADGVLKPGEPDDFGALGSWWSGPHQKGGDWRLRKAIEDEILERIPDGDFMVDPIWAVKIVHGFGGTWTYVNNDPKGIANAVVRLKAMTRPAPAAHGTQLIRGAGHDTLLEANLLAVCMGADKLYHWGINTFEPGREASPAYGKKDLKATPEGFPWFRDKHVANWEKFTSTLYEKRESAAGGRIWAALDQKLRQQVEESVLFVIDGPPDGDVKKALMQALNEALKKKDLYDAKAFGKVDLSARVRELAARHDARGLSGDDLAELNRLVIEATLPLWIERTPVPNIRKLRENIYRKRCAKEPALRTTGRLLRERGELLRDWQPMQPRLALVGGIYSHAELNMALIVGHVPFDILRNPEDRRTHLASYKFAALPKASVSPEDYDDLLKIEQAGGSILVPEGFAPPEGRPALERPVVWKPEDIAAKTPAGKGHEWRATTHKWGRAARGVFHNAGLLPYFDSDNLDVVMQGFVYNDHPMLFVVNDLRTYSAGESALEDKGLPNEVDILIRDTQDGLRVIDIDTGEDVELVRRDDGWHIADTIEPAWYKIYAVLKKGETWDGPGPLAAGPEVLKLKAARNGGAGGVKLTWELPLDDWLGCDVARYLIHRAEGDDKQALLADVPGRIFTGAGGVVTSYVDATARAGKSYVYTVSTVTPLRREGPRSTPAKVTP